MIQLKDIKFRVGSTGKNERTGGNYATCLIYIDARTAMDELDSLYGKGFWSFKWEWVQESKWAVKGTLKVHNKELNEWVEYQDVGYPQQSKREGWSKETNSFEDMDVSDSEWLKDAVSDALKRCSVQVGIGRELYDAPFLYTEEVKVSAKGKVYGLNDMGKQMIQGNINKWYEKQGGAK
jgi:hypothetical protein